MTQVSALPSDRRTRHWIVGATLILCAGLSSAGCERPVTEPSPTLAPAAAPGFDMTGIWEGQYLETACQSTTCPVCCSSRGKTERRQTLRVTVTQDTGALTGMWDEVPQEFTGTLRGSVGGRVSGIEVSLGGLLYPVAATISPVPPPREPWTLRSFSAQLNAAGTAISGSFTLVSIDATGREIMQLRNDVVSLTRVQ